MKQIGVMTPFQTIEPITLGSQTKGCYAQKASDNDNQNLSDAADLLPPILVDFGTKRLDLVVRCPDRF